MFNKVSNKTLIIIFGALIAAAVIYMIIESRQGERTFKSEIVNIDTAKVTAISIYPRATGHKEVRLYKDGDKNWKVKLNDNQTASVPENKIKSLLSMLVQVKPGRVAAQDKSKWAEFKVDTAGTRVKVFEGNDNTLDLIVGKFSFQQPRQMNTFVRLNGEDEVYETEGFLDMAFNQTANSFRNNEIVNDDMSNWKKLTFTYPDNSFELVKNDKSWTINGTNTDSAKTANYLRALAHLTGNSFIDNPLESELQKAEYRLTIESGSKGSIVVTAYGDTSKTILTSSQNEGTYFNGNQAGLMQKIFVSAKHLMSDK
ncbi:MAG TPA: DUF4340 domain-containing protein [Ignavibacteriaceae bacterium]|nr:DUF4340 domain-containing protein [Ignavibacteriaceae bacterium]